MSDPFSPASVTRGDGSLAAIIRIVRTFATNNLAPSDSNSRQRELLLDKEAIPFWGQGSKQCRGSGRQDVASELEALISLDLKVVVS